MDGITTSLNTIRPVIRVVSISLRTLFCILLFIARIGVVGDIIGVTLRIRRTVSITGNSLTLDYTVYYSFL